MEQGFLKSRDDFYYASAGIITKQAKRIHNIKTRGQKASWTDILIFFYCKYSDDNSFIDIWKNLCQKRDVLKSILK